MANSMIDSILALVPPEMTQSLASRLGVSQATVQTGLGTASAATVGSLAQRVAEPGFMDQLTQLAAHAGNQGILGSLTSMASGGMTGTLGDLATRFQSLAFGARQGEVENAIAGHAGMSLGSAGTMLKMAAPLVLGYLTKMHSAGSLTANALKSEIPNLGSFLPSGLTRSIGVATTGTAAGAERLASASVDRLSSATAGAQRVYRSTTASRPGWVIPVAVIAALAVGWLAFTSMQRRPSSVGEATNNAVTATGNALSTAGDRVSNAAADARATVGSFFKTKLPDGTELNIPANGVEDRLIKYLQDSSASTGEVTAFDFDRLLFNTGDVTLRPESREQLDNVAAILKAYPSAKIRLGAYTDNTGDTTANQKLSEARANNVMAELTNRGIDQSRVAAEGYGASNPVADNSTEQGRQQNRRVAIRVAEK